MTPKTKGDKKEFGKHNRDKITSSNGVCLLLDGEIINPAFT